MDDDYLTHFRYLADLQYDGACIEPLCVFITELSCQNSLFGVYSCRAIFARGIYSVPGTRRPSYVRCLELAPDEKHSVFIIPSYARCVILPSQFNDFNAIRAFGYKVACENEMVTFLAVEGDLTEQSFH